MLVMPRTKPSCCTMRFGGGSSVAASVALVLPAACAIKFVVAGVSVVGEVVVGGVSVVVVEATVGLSGTVFVVGAGASGVVGVVGVVGVGAAAIVAGPFSWVRY